MRSSSPRPNSPMWMRSKSWSSTAYRVVSLWTYMLVGVMTGGAESAVGSVSGSPESTPGREGVSRSEPPQADA